MNSIVNTSTSYTYAVPHVLHFLKQLSSEYPDIDNWFIQRVIPGLADGTRKLFIRWNEGNIIALGIAKKTFTERKICTVRVAKDYEHMGIGIHIFREAMNWLETDKPLLSVSEQNLNKFQRIFTHFGFQHTSSVVGIYRPNSTELFYNESPSIIH